MTKVGPSTLMLIVLALPACMVDEPDDVGEWAGELEVENALNPNALNPNALNPNALNPNALNPNALNPNSLSPAAMTAIQDPTATGDLSRQLLKYVVSCALRSNNAFSFSWTDLYGNVHNESYPGLMGLAESWIEEPLTSTGQRWITACLASRTNWYGVTVELSSRGSHTVLKKPKSWETGTYTIEEGAFYGNLFTSTPQLYACYDEANVTVSRARYRDCAAGHLNADGTTSTCGMIQIAGSCASRCSAYGSQYGYWSNCTDTTGQSHANVVTTWLQ